MYISIKMVGGDIIPEDAKPSEDSDSDKIPEGKQTKKDFKVVMLLQIIIIVLLLLNLVLFNLGFFSKDAVISAEEGIDLSIESVDESSIDYNVELSLKNTGDGLAKVSVTGEVYISEMGSATGDEMTKVLNYKYIEIEPDQSKNLELGTFTAFEGWHYVVKVYISWNGGSLELAKMFIPTP